MAKPLRIGLVGFGNIGTGVVNALVKNGDVINSRLNRPLELARIADVDITTPRNAKYDPKILTTDTKSVLADPEIDVIVELIGGLEPARTFVETALKKGKHVVTANKAMLAEFGADLQEIARKKKRALLFEASVGGGIPIIRALQSGIVANRFRSVMGILNGTANYILTEMTRAGKTFDTALKEAQQQGYAEPDPTYDIEGYDTAHKLVILASLCFGQDFRFKDVFCQGITRIAPADIEFARKNDFVIKLLGIAKQKVDRGAVELRVHPTLVSKSLLIANVHEVFNGIMVEGDLVGKTLFYGRGAGPEPTASAVLSDLMALASADSDESVARENRLGFVKGVKQIVPMEELVVDAYVRMKLHPNAENADWQGLLESHGLLGSSVKTGDRLQFIFKAVKEKQIQSLLAGAAENGLCLEEPLVVRIEK